MFIISNFYSQYLHANTKASGEKGQPCLKPVSSWNQSVNHPQFCTELCVSVNSPIRVIAL